jgi:hypothetical protein
LPDRCLAICRYLPLAVAATGVSRYQWRTQVLQRRWGLACPVSSTWGHGDLLVGEIDLACVVKGDACRSTRPRLSQGLEGANELLVRALEERHQLLGQPAQGGLDREALNHTPVVPLFGALLA